MFSTCVLQAQYAREMEVYRSTKARARPPAREEEMALDTKAEKGGYHYFLRDFRVAYKVLDDASIDLDPKRS